MKRWDRILLVMALVGVLAVLAVELLGRWAGQPEPEL
jgi:hypothetical protein